MQNFGGISRYFFELMNNANSVGYQYSLPLLFSSNEYLLESDKMVPKFKVPLSLHSELYRFTNQLNRSYSQFEMKLGKYDLLHPTFYEDYYIEKNIPYVITVYDLINEKFPQYFQGNQEFINRKKKLMENSTRIITISENTKKDIVEYFNINESKIDVTYLAESLSLITSSKVQNLPHRFILFIGKREGYKNFSTMYAAIKDLLLREPDLYLVCAGGGIFSEKEKMIFIQDKLDHKIKYVSFSRNNELKYLYENAICFVFPSLYEGFGIPVLESFAAGCVACVSRSSSLIEIGGRATLYFDPHSPSEIKNAIEKAMLLDKNNKYIEEGFQELKKYNWKKTTEQTFEVYKKC
ncbi:MAG: glycosyltransferase family 1 protein [Bacteriovorax sp.]|nr:glycosyltransferase family 1 protein [Bacteriovorax sp.]